MNDTLQGHLYNMLDQVIDYVPNLFAGLLLIVLGWILGWLVKRVLIQVCVLIRLDRAFRQFQWGKGLDKADVRYVLYNSIGNLGLLIIFLAFLSNSLTIMQLTVISGLLEKGILFLPRFLSAGVIIGIGWLISSSASYGTQQALIKEQVPKAMLIGRFTKGVLLLFFFAMALVELDVAREIVVIGFATVFVTLGLLTVVIAARYNYLSKS